MPVLLPRNWVALLQPAARQPHRDERRARSSGLLTTDALARFDWQLAIGDTTLTEAELAELAAAKEPLIRVRGRWHALRRSEVERALRFLERRREGSVVDLVRAVSGIELEDAGLELGEVTLDDSLGELLAGGDARRFEPLGTPAAMTQPLFPFQERGHGWLRMLGDLGDRRDPRRRHGARKDGAGDRDARSPSGSSSARTRSGPTLVVCPMSVTRQWARETERFAPSLRVHVHHGGERLGGDELADVARASDLVITSYDIATRDIDALATVGWDRLLLDEAQDVKNPATKRARALRRLDARRRLAMTGTPIENRLDELWAIMDIVNPGLLGSRERFQRTFARPIEAYGDERALERLRAMVQPFILRRPKDSPEVELELPKITIDEGVLPAHARAGEPLPRDRRPLDATDRGARAQLRPPRRRARDAEPAEAGLQPPRDGARRRAARSRGAPGSSSGSSSCSRRCLPTTRRSSSRSTPASTGIVPHLTTARPRGRLLPRRPRRPAARRARCVVLRRRTGPSVLVISIRAGGRGLNLPAANHVFHFDRWWNPAVEQQATDRAYRFGQHKDVFVHSLICTATLEERIDELLDSKRELAEKVVAGRADDWLGELDLDTIRAAVMLSDTVGGGGMRVLNDGRPDLRRRPDDDRIGRGPWARWLATVGRPRRGLAARRARAHPRPLRSRPHGRRRRRARSPRS